MNTSLSTAESDDTKLSHSVDSTSNVRGPHDSLSQTYIDNCLLLYDHEGDNLDIMLNPDPDIFSASESMAVNDKSFHTPNSPLFQENETTELTAPWANLTYEALEQPKYFKPLRKGKKSPKILNNIFLAQELRCSVTESSDTESEIERPLLKEPKGSSHTQTLASMNPDEILVMQFSRDGKYLAVAGRDARITVWQVISSPLSRLEYKNQEDTAKAFKKPNSKLKLFQNAPVFLQEPVRVFEGHTNTILCLDWSKNNFLASGSMDKTVKLWNVDRAECLETFNHNDFVTSVRFHPNDDRFFVSGALDDSVQLWSILESSVAYSKNFGENVLITALQFTPLGDHCIVGAFDGSLFILETKDLHLSYRVDVKERSVHNPFHSKDDRKITGIMVFENPHASEKLDSDLGKYHILVTTNDSNVRLIDLNLNKLMTRFKGSHNDGLSVVATVTDDSNYIISGSEDHYFYVWKNDHSIINNKIKASLKEIFEDGKSTLAQNSKLKKIAPDGRWKKLLSLDEHGDKPFISNENHTYTSIHAHHTRCNVAIFAPESTKRLLAFSDDLIYDLVRRRKMMGNTAVKESAQADELERGEIIVTSDSTGLIRVFRQDSAYYARKFITEEYKSLKLEEKNDHSDTGSLTPSCSGYRAELGKLLSNTRSSSPTQDLGASLKMKLQSKLNTAPSRKSVNSFLSMLPFPSLESSSEMRKSESKASNCADAISGTASNLQPARYHSGHIDSRLRSISASEFTRGRASSFLLSSTAMSSTDSLLIKNLYQH